MEYTAAAIRQPQKAKLAVSLARSTFLLPNARAITLAPPTPKRLAIAERNMKAGMHTVTAVIMASLPVRPTKKVSAMLYITSIIWPITAGMARESMASAIGASSKRCFSLLRPFMLLSFYIREKPSKPNLFLLQVHDRRLIYLLAME